MKGYALLVGVNTFDKTHYTNDRYFRDAFDDIPVISDILKDVGIFDANDIHVLIDLDQKPDDGAPSFKIDSITKNPVRKPTADNFLKSIQELYIDQPNSEESFLILFFTGHGACVEVEVKNEDGKMEKQARQFLCFQDRMLLENEMRETLTRIPKNFKVFFVVNACYSGGLSQVKYNLINWQHVFDTRLQASDVDHFQKRNAIHTEIQELGALIFSNENLLLNQYVVDQIVRSKVIDDTLLRHCNYTGKMVTFSKNYMDHEAEFCYLFSCKNDQTTKIGWLDKPSYFINLLKATWDAHKNDPLTYKEFTKKLTASAKPSIQPKLDLFPEGGNTIFETAQVFHYTERTKPNSKQLKSNTMATIHLTPFPNAKPTYVTVDVSGEIFDMDETTSTTYDLMIDDDEHLREILKLLPDSDLIDIRYLGVIDVTEIQSPNGDFPAKIPNMEIDEWCIDDITEDGNGFIVLYDGKAIRGKKRTNGKVSNDVG